MKKNIGLLFVMFFLIFNLTGCRESIKKGTIYVPVVDAYLQKDKNSKPVYNYPFNTTISLTYFYESEKNKAEQYFRQEYINLHKQFDRHYYYFDDNGNLINNLRVINESNGESIPVSDDLINIFKEGIKFTKLSKGKFNIGVGSLSSLWDSFIEIGSYLNIQYPTFYPIERLYKYENGEYIEDVHGSYIKYENIYIDISNLNRYSSFDGTVEDANGSYVLLSNFAPTLAQIEEAKACVPDYTKIDEIIVIDEVNHTIKVNKLQGCNTNVSITLGALAKSYAAEKISNSDSLKNGNYLLNAGQSTIKIIGKNLSRENGNWNIGVTDSYFVRKYNIRLASYGMIIKEPISISTSSGDENHYLSNGNYYHHIIDPISGYPNQNRYAVTVIMSNAMYADIITTSLMSMNIDESKEFFNALKEQGLDVEVFIQDKGENDTPKLLVSEGLKPMISINKSTDYQGYLDSLVIGDF